MEEMRNIDVLGDYSVLLTWEPGNLVALLTVRGKDHDLTPRQLRKLALEALRAAEELEDVL